MTTRALKRFHLSPARAGFANEPLDGLACIDRADLSRHSSVASSRGAGQRWRGLALRPTLAVPPVLMFRR
jgi:hypothetical protein